MRVAVLAGYARISRESERVCAPASALTFVSLSDVAEKSTLVSSNMLMNDLADALSSKLSMGANYHVNVKMTKYEKGARHGSQVCTPLLCP